MRSSKPQNRSEIFALVVKLYMQLDDKGKVEAYRANLNVSFKFEGS